MLNNSEINSLLNKAKSGDDSAVLALTNEFSNVMKAISNSYFIYGGDSDDLYQLALIGFYEAIKKYDGTKNVDFAKFAKICIHSKILDAIKEANRKKHSPLNTAVGIDNVSVVSNMDPEKRFIVREQLLSVYSAIDFKLSDYEKDVLDLFIDGLSYKEIATRIGTTEKSVANAINRIRKKLDDARKS